MMNVGWRLLASFLVLAPSLDCAQQPPQPANPVTTQPLEVALADPPVWKDAWLRIDLRLVNHSEFPIFLPHTPFEGIEIYSSVTDSTNTLGQGIGEAWLLVYGWTDVFYRGKGSSVLGAAETQRTVWLSQTFPVKPTGKTATREVRMQGRLRIYVSYDQALSSAAKKNAVARVSGRAMLETPIPCAKSRDESDCTAPPPVFQGEHDVRTFEMQPPPELQIEPASLPTFPVAKPSPPPQR
jgi:hypothetical protein